MFCQALACFNHIQTMDPCQISDILLHLSRMNGFVVFSGGVATFVMPVEPSGTLTQSVREEHAHCTSSMLLHPPKDFKWNLHLTSGGEVAEVTIQQQLSERITLLSSMPEAPGDDVKKITFEAPAGACSLACVLILLEGTVSPGKLFSGPCGPRLASQTLWVRNPLLQRNHHIRTGAMCYRLLE